MCSRVFLDSVLVAEPRQGDLTSVLNVLCTLWEKWNPLFSSLTAAWSQRCKKLSVQSALGRWVCYYPKTQGESLGWSPERLDLSRNPCYLLTQETSGERWSRTEFDIPVHLFSIASQTLPASSNQGRSKKPWVRQIGTRCNQSPIRNVCLDTLWGKGAISMAGHLSCHRQAHWPQS